MPLFFFISGYLEKGSTTNPQKLIQKKTSSLLYPYFSFGVLIIIYNSMKDLISNNFILNKLGKRLIALFYGNYIWENNIDYIGTLWFLIALFCTEVLFGIILIYIKKFQMQLVAVVFLGVIGFSIAMMEKQLGFRLPWCLDIALIACLFYCGGYCWKKWSSTRHVSSKIGVFLGIFGGICGILNYFYMNIRNYEVKRVDMLYLNFGFIPAYILSGVLCSLGCLILCKNFLYVNRCNVLNHAGRMSLIIMVIHLYIMNILNMIGSKIGVSNTNINLIATIIISYIFSCIIERYFSFIYRLYSSSP